jgi:gamma-glutamyltranspeptidase / glutathione hydrolase
MFRTFSAFIFTASTACLLYANAAAQVPAPAASETPARAQHAMVVTIHHEATDAGLEILHQGGNAVDAAVAVGFALAVVQPQTGNIGGGGFMLIRPASGKGMGRTDRVNHGDPVFLDYREKAPAAASRDMYLDAKGNIIPKMSTVGAKASGVPGTVAGLVYAEKHFGKLTLSTVMAPAIRLAAEGYVLSAEEARAFHSPILAQFETSKHIFQRDGNFYVAGDRFIQPILARTLNHISENPDDFYHGTIADQIATFEHEHGGLITAADLAAYQVKERTPLIGHYRGLEVVTAPPPSSGGIALIETLNILSGFDLHTLGPDRSPAQVHVIVEAFRRAYMDRADYLGDPDFNSMPIAQMAAQPYADAWRQTISANRPTPSAQLVRPAGFLPPPPTAAPQTPESHQTTHFSVVDADGNAVSSTYTLNFYFGNGMTVDNLGFLLNDEMDDFASKMGVPNGFGLIQGPANAIAPGHRPLSSMTPTIVCDPDALDKNGRVTKPGKLRLVLGSPGGSTIITTVANDLISVIDNGLNIQAAADAPRFHHQYLPDVVQVEKAFPLTTINALELAGYNTERAGARDENSPGTWGDSELIARDPKTGELTGGQDHRHHYGKAAGY